MTKEMRNEVRNYVKGCIESSLKIREKLQDDNISKEEKMQELPIHKYVLIANKNIISALGVDLMAERLYNTSIDSNEIKK